MTVMRMLPRHPDAMSTANLQSQDSDGHDPEELKDYQLGNTAKHVTRLLLILL